MLAMSDCFHLETSEGHMSCMGCMFERGVPPHNDIGSSPNACGGMNVNWLWHGCTGMFSMHEPIFILQLNETLQDF